MISLTSFDALRVTQNVTNISRGKSSTNKTKKKQVTVLPLVTIAYDHSQIQPHESNFLVRVRMRAIFFQVHE